MSLKSPSCDVTFRLSRHRRSVARARAALLALIEGRGLQQESCEAAELVLSELVTNAVLARAPQDRLVEIHLRLHPHDSALLIEVSDAAEGLPAPRSPQDDDPTGRGLLLVTALTDRWGVRPREAGPGKTVWAVLGVAWERDPHEDGRPLPRSGETAS